MGMALGVMGMMGAALGGVGSYESAEASAQAASYQAQVARNNALIANQNAAWAGEAGAAKESAQGMKNAAQVGNLKAKQGASGVDVNTGSSANVAAAAAELGNLDLGTTRSNTAREVYGYETQSVSDTAQANLDQAEASNYSTMAPLGALGTFLSGASSVGAKYASLYGGGSGSSSNGLFGIFGS